MHVAHHCVRCAQSNSRLASLVRRACSIVPQSIALPRITFATSIIDAAILGGLSNIDSDQTGAIDIHFGAPFEWAAFDPL